MAKKKISFAEINSQREEAQKQNSEVVGDKRETISKKRQAERRHVYFKGDLFDEMTIHMDRNHLKLSELVHISLNEYLKNHK